MLLSKAALKVYLLSGHAYNGLGVASFVVQGWNDMDVSN